MRAPSRAVRGVEQVLIGIAAGLSALDDGDEEFLFLPPRRGRLDPAPCARPCSAAADTAGRLQRTARAIGRGLAERIPRIGPVRGPRLRRDRGAPAPTWSTSRSRTPSSPSCPASTSRTTSCTSTIPSSSAPGSASAASAYTGRIASAEMVVAMTSGGDLLERTAFQTARSAGPLGLRPPQYPQPSKEDLDRLRAPLPAGRLSSTRRRPGPTRTTRRCSRRWP